MSVERQDEAAVLARLQDEPATLPLVVASCEALAPGTTMEKRDRLLKEYMKRYGSVLEQLKSARTPGEQYDVCLDSVAFEIDKLLGNELVFVERDDLHSATGVTTKRIEALEKLAKVLHRKMATGKMVGFDLDHHHVKLLFTYILRKARDVLRGLKIDEEVIDLFFATMGQVTTNWQTEVKALIQATPDNA